MEEVLLRGSDEQAIASLYKLIKHDPDFLHDFDRKPFAAMPLHLAAGEGRTLLALEIQRLMPSFCTKLNTDGLTPVDLAMRRGHGGTAGAMIKLNPGLARVQGREGITPLHLAAEADDADLLAQILLTCPKSIDVLTVREESAAHVAVRNRKWAAFRVLCGWLQWRIQDFCQGGYGLGYTILDADVSTNQYEYVSALASGKYSEAGASELTTTTTNATAAATTVAQYLSSKVSIWEKMIKLGAYLDYGIRSETRNSLLVVAVLIATATYQAVLSPPGGVPGGGDPMAPIYMNIDLYAFMQLNSLALAVSLVFIFSLLPIRLKTFLLHLSIVLLMVGYLLAVKLIWPLDTMVRTTFYYWGTCICFSSLIILKLSFVSARYSFIRFHNQLYLGSDRGYNISELVRILYETNYSSSSNNSIA
ncbi:PREDICTED: uncharacterized protein LOC105955081 [Erythranthe guttata]|uniref:uncharacterized protein LOC105955081 n=1 Tax=Erythranthe guttata TaxID=4155 RepID=UPI00064DA4C1|nr:PREDICTED: uncharacterized protein LOC105955081 [Erythranthe guttata]|eukprot:XP_012834234.1 PREDICTED: uncharacterized protein LOC105955081 [Erythranthe guttata]